MPEEIYKQHHPYPEDIYWLIEVSNRTLEKAEQRGLGEPVRCGGSPRYRNWRGFPHERLFQEDLKEKTITYARNGISEYWVIDLPNKKLWVFAQPEKSAYRQIKEFTTDIVFPQSFPNVSIEVKRLLLY